MAVTVTVAVAFTTPVLIVELAVVWPGWTTSVEGSGKAEGLLLDSAITAPAGAGAGPLSIAVRVADPPAGHSTRAD